jgi:ABC-type uncharacterized transport system substrate-binding protein
MAMRRRDFIAGLGGAAAWPMVARSQQSAMPVIGFLDVSAASASNTDSREEFFHGLSDAGFVVGHNVAVEYRSAEGQVDRLPALAADLVQRKVAVLFGTLAAALAAKTITSTIPIVFVTSADPVVAGAIPSLSRPSGNITGVRLRAGQEATTKQTELIHDLLPNIAVIGVMISPKFPDAEPGAAEVETASRSMGLKVSVVRANDEKEFDPAISKLAQDGAGALLVIGNYYFYGLRDKIISIASRYALPVITASTSFTVSGGLASYGGNINDGLRQGGVYVGRILKGENPANMPVSQPTKFDLMINLKTAKAFGITVAPTLLARADEVIE